MAETAKVKLTISEDPIDVHPSEIPVLEGQGLLEEVLEPAAPRPRGADAGSGGPAD